MNEVSWYVKRNWLFQWIWCGFTKMFPFISDWDYWGQKMTHSVILERRSAVSDKKLDHRRNLLGQNRVHLLGMSVRSKSIHPSTPRRWCWRDISHRQRLKSLSSTTMIIKGGALNYSVDGRSLFCLFVSLGTKSQRENHACGKGRGKEGWSAHMPEMKVEIPV